MKHPHKNVTDHPLDAGTTVVGSGEFADIDPDNPYAAQAIEAGQLVPASRAERGKSKED